MVWASTPEGAVIVELGRGLMVTTLLLLQVQLLPSFMVMLIVAVPVAPAVQVMELV